MWSRDSSSYQSECSPKNSLAGSVFKPTFSALPQARFPSSEFNLRSHYQGLKENHPYYQQLLKPHQNAIKFSYLDRNLPIKKIEQVKFYDFHVSLRGHTQDSQIYVYKYQSHQKLTSQRGQLYQASQKEMQIDQMQYQPEQMFFEKGSYVFGKCVGSLFWPGKIIKVDQDNQQYTIKFSDKSTATLTCDNVMEFTDKNCFEVLQSYQKQNKPTKKIEKDIYNYRKQIEKKHEKEEIAVEKKQKKNKNYMPTQQTSVSQQKQQKNGKKSKKNTKLDEKNSIAKQSPMNDNNEANNYTVKSTNVEQEQLVKPITEVRQELVIKQNRQVYMKEQQEDTNQVQIQNNIEPAIVSYNSDIDLLAQSIVLPAQPFDSFAENQQAHEKNQKVQLVHSNVPENVNVAEPSNISQSINEQSLNEAKEIMIQVVESIPEQKAETNVMQMQPDMALFQNIEAEDKEKKDIETICVYLRKMSDYLNGKTCNPLTKDEKLEFSILLQSYRNLYYEPNMMESMVDFIKSFDFKLKIERKNCIIEYVRIKEKLDIACLLKKQLDLNYNELTLQHLKRYASMINMEI